MNGGFGHVLDGTADAAVKARKMLSWDVANGVARRSWSGKTSYKMKFNFQQSGALSP